MALPLFVQPAAGRPVDERKPCNNAVTVAVLIRTSATGNGVDERKHELNDLGHGESFDPTATITGLCSHGGCSGGGVGRRV